MKHAFRKIRVARARHASRRHHELNRRIQLVNTKYYLAGTCARFMFSFTDDEIKQTVEYLSGYEPSIKVVDDTAVYQVIRASLCLIKLNVTL